MHRICVLLMGSINRDSRVQRTLKIMAKHCLVDLYTILNKNETLDSDLYFSNVTFYTIENPKDHSFQNKLISKFIKHTLFYLNHSNVVKFVLAQQKKYDVIYAHDLTSAYPALKIAQKFNAKIIYDVHDLYIETINQQFPINTGGLKQRLYNVTIFTMKYWGKRFEKIFFKNVDLLYTTNPSYLNYLKENYSFSKGVVVGNYPEFIKVTTNQKLKEHLKIDKKQHIVIYHGNLGRGRKLEFIVKSAFFFPDNVNLVIIGSGTLKENLQDISKNQGTEHKVFFLPPVKYKYLFDTVASATLGLMLLDPINKSKEYALANKVTEYMACGIVPVVSDHVENKRLVQNTDSGFVFKGTQSPKAFGAFIKKCLESEELLKIKSNNAKENFKEFFNWEKEQSKFATHFLKLIQ